MFTVSYNWFVFRPTYIDRNSSSHRPLRNIGILWIEHDRDSHALRIRKTRQILHPIHMYSKSRIIQSLFICHKGSREVPAIHSLEDILRSRIAYHITKVEDVIYQLGPVISYLYENCQFMIGWLLSCTKWSIQTTSPPPPLSNDFSMDSKLATWCWGVGRGLISKKFLRLKIVEPLLSGAVLSSRPLLSSHLVKSRKFHNVNSIEATYIERSALLSGRGHLLLSPKHNFSLFCDFIKWF